MESNSTVYQTYVKILQRELVPAMGCTEPIAIAYCAAMARSVLGALVVGSTGVINAGSLTMITSGKKFKNALDSLEPDAAAAAIAANNWDVDAKAKIDIHGQINTATGIDLPGDRIKS